MSTKGRMMERLRVILAGRAAEEVPICVHFILHHPLYLQLAKMNDMTVPPNYSSGGAASLLSAWGLQQCQNEQALSCDWFH